MGFNISLSGIKAASTDLDVIGNNIANAGTVGFKQSKAHFSDVYAQSALGISEEAIGSGVNLSTVQQAFTQGTLNFTDNNLDIAISGQGFFQMDSNGSTVYTRAGIFEVDRDGFLVNPQGLNVRGFLADTTSTPPTISSTVGVIQLDRSNIEPQATTAVDKTINIPANADNIALAFDSTDPDTFTNATSVTVFDSLGNSHETRFYYRKIAGGAGLRWEMYTQIDGTTVDATGVSGPGVPVTFDMNDTGTVLTFVEPALPANQPPVFNLNAVVTPAAAQDLTVRMNNITSFGAPFSVAAISQNGYTTGRLDTLDVDSSGIIFGRFTNGQNRPLGQFVIANFSNVNGLQPLGDTTWGETFASGGVIIGTAGTGSLGNIQSGALEDSNVDLTNELVRLIIAQRNFQANAQAIRTEDEVTQTVLQF